MADKVSIVNLAPWPVGFPRINTIGAVNVPAYGRLTVDREEIVSQCHNGNIQFTGLDGKGSHALYHIEDAEIRKEFEFDTETRKQNILTDEKLAKLFEYKRLGDFEKNLKEYVRIHAEKFVLVDYIKKHKINDYDKIKAVEKYTGIKVE